MSAGLLCHALNRLPSRFSERLFGVFKRKSPDGKAAKLFHSIINDALQGSEGYAVAILYNSDDPDATARAEGFYDEAMSQVGYMPWDTYTYTSNTMTDFTVQLYQCQEAGVEAIYLPVTNQDEFYNLLGMLITQCDAMGFYPTFYDSDGLRIELTIEDVYDYLGLGV